MDPSQPSSATKPAKKKRSSQQISSSDTGDTTAQTSPVASTADSPGAQRDASSVAPPNFRNVSACNRCRLRKNRCDQKLPACTSCDKANVKCVGYDPVSKREIPRSYVYYLESRVQHLEALLQSNDIPYAPPEDLSLGLVSHSDIDPALTHGQHAIAGAGKREPSVAAAAASNGTADVAQREERDRDRLHKLVSNIGMVSVQGASDPRYLGSTSGISFARVVFAAVKSSVSNAPSERAGVRPSKPLGAHAATGGTTMRDSFFGLHTKPTIHPAPFPDREVGTRLVDLYFEHSNPQIPVLHRGEFMTLVDRVYATEEKKRTPRELYMLNIVFAIGSGIIMDSSGTIKKSSAGADDSHNDNKQANARKRQKLTNEQAQPEEYHASAIVHLESFLGSSPAIEGVSGGLEELQAVLLLAGFALLRPVAPGLWYIIGVAVRLGIDLGLHFEDHDGASDLLAEAGQPVLIGSAGQHPDSQKDIDSKERGRRQWTRDLRRRLWWCVYSFDRLVSTCVGRPFGITDQAVTTEFPSLLDDKYITTSGFMTPPASAYSNIPSYKHVSHHYFRLRLLQSEILQVLQHRQAQQARANGVNQGNQFMHTSLPSPFLHNFSSFSEWRMDVDRRLYEWKESSPTQTMTGVQFTPLFLDLNYWQAVIMLYRQSLSVPSPLVGELETSMGDDVHTPGHVSLEEQEDEEKVFLKVAEAGQRVLKIYRQLHRVRLVNYTYLATHHLFMCGISFLYAIWHSTVVRSKLTLDDVDFTVLAATSVLGDLIEKCPPAEACRDAFERMSKATISMCMSTTGFGQQAASFIQRQAPEVSPEYFNGQQRPALQQQYNSYPGQSQSQTRMQQQPQPPQPRPNAYSRRPAPIFDMNLKDLFSDDDLATRGSAPRRLSRASLHEAYVKPEPSNQSIASSSRSASQATMPPPQHIPSPQYYDTSPIDPSLQMTPPLSRVSSAGQQTPRPGQQQQQQQQQHRRQQQQQMGYGLPAQQQSYSPFPQQSASYPNNMFDSLDFLDDYQTLGAGGAASGGNAAADAAMGGSGATMGVADWDLGFGAGGLAFDGGAGAAWDDANGGFDLFDGFFFGGGAGGAGIGEGL